MKLFSSNINTDRHLPFLTAASLYKALGHYFLSVSYFNFLGFALLRKHINREK